MPRAGDGGLPSGLVHLGLGIRVQPLVPRVADDQEGQAQQMPVQRAVGLYLVQGGAQGGHAGVLLSVHHAGLQGAVELQEGHRRGGGTQGFHHLQIDRAVLYPDVQPLHIGRAVRISRLLLVKLR